MFNSDQFRPGHQLKVLRLENIYKAVRIALSMGDTTRFDILRAGLACFSKHALLFRPFFTATAAAAGASKTENAAAAAAGTDSPAVAGECETVLGLLISACRHANITVSSRANWALEAFLQQVAAWLVELKPQPDAADSSAAAAASSSTVHIPAQKRRIFNLLLASFYKKIDGSRAASEVSLAVRAMGQLAKVVLLYMSEADLRKILSRLLDASEKLFRAHTLDEVDRAVTHMPDFISAFAFILKSLRTVDNSVVDYLVHLIRRF